MKAKNANRFYALPFFVYFFFTHSWLTSTYLVFSAGLSYLTLYFLKKLIRGSLKRIYISYILIVVILDLILILNRQHVDPRLFEGISLGLIIGLVTFIFERDKD